MKPNRHVRATLPPPVRRELGARTSRRGTLATPVADEGRWMGSCRSKCRHRAPVPAAERLARSHLLAPPRRQLVGAKRLHQYLTRRRMEIGGGRAQSCSSIPSSDTARAGVVPSPGTDFQDRHSPSDAATTKQQAASTHSGRCRLQIPQALASYRPCIGAAASAAAARRPDTMQSARLVAP